MQVIHSIWDGGAFYIWGESSSLPLSSHGKKRKGHPDPPADSAHPFAVPQSNLMRQLPTGLRQKASGAKSYRLCLRLPAGSAGPLPSPWLLREDFSPEKPLRLLECTVPALVLDGPTAVEMLLGIAPQPSAGTAYADSTLFWSELCLFALELVGRQQFVPALSEENRAYWKAVIDEKDEERCRAFAGSIPPGCLAFSACRSSSACSSSAGGPASAISPGWLVKSFLNYSVDWLVRGSLSHNGTPILSQRRGRPAKNGALARQFIKALLAQNADDAALEAQQEDLHAFGKELGNWTDVLHPQAEDVAFRTCFRLEAPPAEAEDDLWHLSIFLQAKDDRSLLVPAEEVWRTRSKALTVLLKRLSNPQEQLLADLGRAERVFPMIGSCLDTARPTGLAMQTEEAYSFLREKAPLLEQNGFGVLLPTWWQRPASRLGVKLHLSDRPKKDGRAGPSLFGLDDLVRFDWQLFFGDRTLSEAEFKELSRLKVPLVRMRGEWIELSAQDIESAIAFFRERKERDMPLSEALRLGLGLGLSLQDGILPDAGSALPVLGVSVSGKIEEMLAALSRPHAQLQDSAQPESLQGTLRPYQLRGVSWLEYLHRLGLGACLADDMGLGKTVELIAFLLRIKKQEKDQPDMASGPALLICPLSVAGNWAREIQRFAPSLSVLTHHGINRLTGSEFVKEASSRDVVITTYALASKDEEDLSAVFWGHVILDEAQNIKNQEAQQTRAIKRLACQNRIALTGTPVENRLAELWSIMDFLNPGYLGSKEAFRKQFTLPIEKYRNQERSVSLRSIIQPFILRRLKTDPAVIRDLPLKMEMKVNYSLTEEQASLYAAVVEEMLGKIFEMEGIKRRGQILAALTKLKQICNHPALFLQDASSLDGRSGKLARLEEMLYEAASAGDRSLIFTQFAGMGAMLRHHIQEKMGLEALFLHGGTPRAKREEMIARFQAGSTPVFILSLKAGGFGLNLTAANHVFHFDRWWNPAVENQATDRAFRIGQKKNVFVHKFVCLGTLEEKIDEMIESKKSLADSVIGSGEAWLTEMSDDALRQIFTLRREEGRG